MITSRFSDYSRIMTLEELGEIITKKQLAQLLGKSPSTISRMVKDDRIPRPLLTPHGRCGGWFKRTVDDWMNQHQAR